MLSDGYALLTSAYSNAASVDATSIRVDHAISSKATIFGRFNYSPSGLATRGTPSLSPTAIETNPYKTRTLTVGSTQTLSHNILNDLRFNDSRSEAGSTTQLDTFGGGVPVDPSTYLSGPLPTRYTFQLAITGGGANGFSVGTNAANVQRQRNLVDSLAISMGQHQIKMGVDYRRMTPEHRLKLTFQLIEDTRTLSAAGVRFRHPEYTERQVC